MTTVVNLANNHTMDFDHDTTPLWAVCFAFCEEKEKKFELFKWAHAGRFLEFARTLPVTVGRDTVACGDWAAMTKEI